ncbi:MAG: heme exporter protein CcmB [Pseudomonadota bacterium]
MLTPAWCALAKGGFTRTLWPVLARDLKTATRTGGGWLQALFFFAVFCTAAVFAIGPERAALSQTAAAMIWLGGAFAVQLAAPGIFSVDLEDGALPALAAENPSLSGYYCAKVLLLIMLASAPIALLSPVFFIFFALSPGNALSASAAVLMGAPTLALTAATTAALGSGSKGGGVLSTALAAPIVTPVIIFGVAASEQAATGVFFSPELRILGALTLFYAVALPPIAISALRVTLE